MCSPCAVEARTRQLGARELLREKPDPTLSMNPTDQKRLDRFALLSALYDDDEASGGRPAEMTTLGARLGFGTELTVAHVRFLAGNGLVDVLELDGNQSIVTISQRGRNEVEEARSAPERATDHFPPHVVHMTINVETMNNSQIQAGSPGGSQSMHVASGDLTGLPELIGAFAGAVRASSPPADVRAHAEAEIATVQAQAASPKPRWAAITGGLAALAGVAKSAAALGHLAAEWAPKLVNAMDRLPTP
ncbi:hypothetical protein tb265_00280 [Gemmatimonadetes bacterium T265]|nr:hypothetical protein tb265_00280 [Gemmatimonadetes bacterium T265]